MLAAMKPMQTSSEKTASNATKRTWRTRILFLVAVILVMWGLEVFDFLLCSGQLDSYGIRPRTLAGLWGVLLSPFLHAGFAHLMANTLPFLILGFFLLSRGARDFSIASALILLVGGLGVWLTGDSDSVHIGASIWIFGAFGFLLLAGFFERRMYSVLVSLSVGIFYGGMLWGILPTDQRVSWQGHLFGFIGGICAARILTRRDRSGSKMNNNEGTH